MVRSTTTIDRHVRFTLTVAAALAVVPLVATAAPPTTAPAAAADAPVPAAVADVQDLIARKQYPAAVRAASKLLAVHGDGADGVSRFQVTMLKGDAQAGTHAIAAARATYLQASRETQDPHERALAVWTATLFGKARGTAYVPHVTGAGNGAANGAAIDLVDRDSRKAAFAALLDDEMSALRPKIKSAGHAPNLPAILPVVQQVQDLAELDEIANGSDAATAADAKVMLDHARGLMTTSLKGMWTRVSDIYASATRPMTAAQQAVLVGGQLVQQTLNSQAGLTQQDRADLQDIIVTCGKIRSAADTFASLAAGGQDQDWGAVENDATRVAGRANDVLQGNYSSTSISQSGSGTGTDGNTNGYNSGLNGTVNGVSIGGNGITSTYGPGITGQITNPRTGGVTVTSGGGGTTGGTPGTTTTGSGSGGGNTTDPGTGTGGATPTPTPTPTRPPVQRTPPRHNTPPSVNGN